MSLAQAAPASPGAIPFDTGAASVASGSGTSLLVAFLLLALAYAALWYVRKRGWGMHGSSPGSTMEKSLKVEQRLRLGGTCMAYVLRDGDSRLLVVESRQGLQVSRLDEKEASP